jgi:hypothetical protein
MAPIDRVLPTLFPALQACTLSPYYYIAVVCVSYRLSQLKVKDIL